MKILYSRLHKTVPGNNTVIKIYLRLLSSKHWKSVNIYICILRCINIDDVAVEKKMIVLTFPILKLFLFCFPLIYFFSGKKKSIFTLVKCILYLRFYVGTWAPPYQWVVWIFVFSLLNPGSNLIMVNLSIRWLLDNVNLVRRYERLKRPGRLVARQKKTNTGTGRKT